MAYKLLVTCDNASLRLQWAEKPDGTRFHRNEPMSFVITSDRKDCISSDDFLKQTGLKRVIGVGSSDIHNFNGWKIEVIG